MLKKSGKKHILFLLLSSVLNSGGFIPKIHFSIMTFFIQNFRIIIVSDFKYMYTNVKTFLTSDYIQLENTTVQRIYFTESIKYEALNAEGLLPEAVPPPPAFSFTVTIFPLLIFKFLSPLSSLERLSDLNLNSLLLKRQIDNPSKFTRGCD